MKRGRRRTCLERGAAWGAFFPAWIAVMRLDEAHTNTKKPRLSAGLFVPAISNRRSGEPSWQNGRFR